MGRLGVLIFVIPSLCVRAASYSACDVNQDGVVNIVDVQLIVNQALGLSPCTAVNIDGSCDIGAVQRVINAALGQPCNTSGQEVTAGLVGYWKMDESSGTVVHDSSGYGYDGTTVNATGDWSWDPTGGKINGAFHKYSGTNPITIPNNSQINFTGDFSVALWIKASSGVQNFIWKANTVGFQGYGIGLNGNGSQVIAYLDSAICLGNELVPAGQWAHIAVTKSGPTLTIYINGVADTPFSVPATITATTAPLIVGLGGFIDDVRLYNRVLSSAEVQTIMGSNGSYVGATQTVPPNIASFAASPSPINAGQPATLTWAVSGATAVSIDNGLGAQSSVTSGTVSVSPTATTTYTLTATNAGASTTAIATVVVNQPPLPPSTNVIITSPAANSVVSGTINLTVDITGLSGVASVKYFLNQREIFNAGDPVGPIASPYSYSWITNNVWDSWSQLTAQALDSSGNVLSTSAPVPIQIANGSYTLAQVTPAPGQTITGAVTWNVSTNAPPGTLIKCFVDGVQANPGGAPFMYDTTQLPNGSHDFHCVIAPPQSINVNNGNGYQTPVAMSSTFFYVDNGRTPMQLQANYRILYMTPGQAQNLTAQLVYTNGDRTPVLPAFYIDNSSVATVTASGTVTAVADGVANVNVTANGKTTTTQVIVSNANILPHFSKSGDILTVYDPNNSLFVRTLFGGPLPNYDLDPKKTGDPNMIAETNAAAINVLTVGIYSNPADQSGWNPSNYSNQNTFANFKQQWDATDAQSMSDLTANDWSILLTGDDIARSTNEMIDSIFDPYSTQKIQYLLNYWKNSGKALGIEMIDEADGDWGCDPLASAAGYWNKWSPSFVTSPFIGLESILNGVPRPNIAWPTLGIGGPVCLQNWQGNPNFADYTSLYWDRLWGTDPYPDGDSNYEVTSSFENKYVASLPLIQRDKPLLVLVGFSGPSWNKNVTGTGFDPAVDTLLHPAWTPTQVSDQIFLDIAKGAAGVRLYQLEHWADAAIVWPAGTQFVQVGTSPHLGIPRWAAMSAAFNLVKSLEPYVLSPMTNAPDLGPFVETGAHSGAAGNLLIAINTLDNPQTIAADLTPYVTGFAVTRYRLVASSLATQNLGFVTSDQVTLNPGEVALYVFPSQ